jgi:hypothetical protein
VCEWLFRPVSPFRDDPQTHLDGTPVLIIDEEKDSRRSPGDGARLAERLREVRTTVTHHVLPVGHSITPMGSEAARELPMGCIAHPWECARPDNDDVEKFEEVGQIHDASNFIPRIGIRHGSV